MDYRFGWRWLLPASDGDRVVAIGLSPDEKRWWAETESSLLFLNEATNVTGWLIALDTAQSDALAHNINDKNTGWVCVWGGGSAIESFRSNLNGYTSILEFALLPANKPRVVVPLSNAGSAVAGLRLHRPGRWGARFGVWVACWLSHFGFYALLKKRVLLVASSKSDRLPMGAIQSGLSRKDSLNQPDFALYLGTADENRKTVVLPIDGKNPTVILKIAELPKARTALHKESKALLAMSQCTLGKYVPSLVSLTDAKGKLTMVQEYRQRRFASQSRMNLLVKNFLINLSTIGRSQINLAELLSSLPLYDTSHLPDKVVRAILSLRRRLDNFSSNNTQMWRHRSHGDFAPWNCIWTDKGLFVFDWEESQERDVALGDAFYYILSPYVHIYKKPNANKALAAVLRIAKEVAVNSGFENIEVHLYLAFWLLSHLGESPLYETLIVLLDNAWFDH